MQRPSKLTTVYYWEPGKKDFKTFEPTIVDVAILVAHDEVRPFLKPCQRRDMVAVLETGTMAAAARKVQRSATGVRRNVYYSFQKYINAHKFNKFIK